MPFTRLRQSLIQPNGSITGSLLGTASYAITSSYAMNGGSGGGSTPVVSVASLNNQTILYNFSSSQEATITGLTLTNNNWGINVVEEWNSASIVGDQYYPSCSLLLHCDGTNGSTTFTDNSPSPKTVTSNNGAAISTTQSKFGGASGFFDGTNDYLTLASDAAFGTGTGDFTIEFWMYPVSVASGWVFDNRTGGAAQSVTGYFSAAGSFTFTGGVITTGITKTSITVNSWYHIACVRNGGTAYLFVNGISAGTDSVVGSANSSNPFTIGSKYDGTNAFNGYIDDFRYTKGVARYTGSFTTSSVAFPNSVGVTQYATKYIGLVGGLNDTNVDYGVEKLSDGSLKIKKLTDTQQPSGSFLSSSVDRVYVNVLNYSNISVGSTLLGQAFTAVGSTSSYALSRSVVNPYEIVVAVDGAVQSFNNAYSVTSSTINFTENIPSGSLVDIRYLTTPNVNSASYAATSSFASNSVNSLDIPKIKSIIYTNSGYTPTTASAIDLVLGNNYIIISGSNFKSSASVFIDATTGSIVSYVNENQLNVNVATKTVGTYPIYLMNTDGASTFKINAITYIAGTTTTTKAIFGYGVTSVGVSITNLVSNTGTVATDTTGVGTARWALAAAGYGTDKAIFGYGIIADGTGQFITNKVSNTGVVATDTAGVGTARYNLAAAGYGSDKAIFGYGYNGSSVVSMTNLVSNTGVVATDTTGVGTARRYITSAGYGSDKAIFGYGQSATPYLSMTNLVSNTGVVANDTTGVGTARYYLAAAGYGSDKAIFGYGNNGSNQSMTNLVSNTGVVATDTTGVGTSRAGLAAVGYGNDKAIFGYGYTSGVVSMTNLVSNTGVVATDTTGVGTAREGLAAAGYSTT